MVNVGLDLLWEMLAMGEVVVVTVIVVGAVAVRMPDAYIYVCLPYGHQARQFNPRGSNISPSNCVLLLYSSWQYFVTLFLSDVEDR